MKHKLLLGLALSVVLIIAGGLLFNWNRNKSNTGQNGGPASSYAAESNLIEIFYLPHAPAEAAVKKVEDVAAEFPKFKVMKYNFDDPHSDAKINEYGLKEHMPVAIFIGGKNDFEINGKKVILSNFPHGDSFIPGFEGNWTYDDLRHILQTLK
jgi:hypothetical protein